jgi:pimeloyl-ACP methyl ester carboxylesterase
VATVTERSVHVNGIDLHLAEAGPGSGPPVVLLHGFPESWKMWRHQVPALAGAGHRVLAPDLRGFGETSRPAEVEAYKLRTLVADVTGLLDLLGIERAAVVGHDWGAGLAWRVAMFAPGRVERLVAVSVGHPLAGIATGLAQWRMSWYMMWFLLPGVAERVLPPTTGPSTAAGPGTTPSVARTPTSTASWPTCPAPAPWSPASTGTGPTSTRSLRRPRPGPLLAPHGRLPHHGRVVQRRLSPSPRRS